ncbi:MAG: hypothetical protein ACE5GO_06310 [Anaerolineales bacterium]
MAKPIEDKMLQFAGGFGLIVIGFGIIFSIISSGIRGIVAALIGKPDLIPKIQNLKMWEKAASSVLGILLLIVGLVISFEPLLSPLVPLLAPTQMPANTPMLMPPDTPPPPTMNTPTPTDKPANVPAPVTTQTPTPTVTPLPTNTPMPTNTPTLANTPTPAQPSPTSPVISTSTPTATSVPKPTPTLSLLLPAPTLLEPKDGVSFDGPNSEIILGWNAVKPSLAVNERYLIIIPFRPKQDPNLLWYDYACTQETSWSVGKHDYLLDKSADGQFSWLVALIHFPEAEGEDCKLDITSKEVPEDLALTQTSEEWTFTWRGTDSSGGDGGGGTPTPDHN